jgi:hypothetical protein
MTVLDLLRLFLWLCLFILGFLPSAWFLLQRKNPWWCLLLVAYLCLYLFIFANAPSWAKGPLLDDDPCTERIDRPGNDD